MEPRHVRFRIPRPGISYAQKAACAPYLQGHEKTALIPGAVARKCPCPPDARHCGSQDPGRLFRPSAEAQTRQLLQRLPALAERHNHRHCRCKEVWNSPVDLPLLGGVLLKDLYNSLHFFVEMPTFLLKL